MDEQSSSSYGDYYGQPQAVPSNWASETPTSSYDPSPQPPQHLSLNSPQPQQPTHQPAPILRLNAAKVLRGTSTPSRTTPARRNRPRTSQTHNQNQSHNSSIGRSSTRFSTRGDPTSKPSYIPKIRFKNSNGTQLGPTTSFLGEYDRDLDENPEEPLVFEEQFILRVPREVVEEKGLGEMVKGKGKGLEGVEFKFLDSRRAVFKIGGVSYGSKLVDLPCIIESQKTFDNSHLFKVADISQMLVVENRIEDEDTLTATPLKIDDYIWPHGITPPLRHVRKRRFRKRLSRRAIEDVEEQVELLMSKDSNVDVTQDDLREEQMTVEFLDVPPGAERPDEYYVKYDVRRGRAVGYDNGTDMGDNESQRGRSGSVLTTGDQYEEGMEYGEGEDGGSVLDDGIDPELAKALARSLGQHFPGDDNTDREDDDDDDEEEDDEEEEEDFDEAEKSEGEEDDDDDEETMEKRAKIRQFTSEIKALELAIERKRAGLQPLNPIMMKRFEETLAGMRGDAETKIASRQVLIDELDVQAAEKRGALEALRRSKEQVIDGDKHGRSGDRDGDVDMGGVTDVGGDDTSTLAGTTPAIGTPAVYEEEDLFGDEEESVMATDAEGDAGTPRSAYAGEDAEGEEEDEMARMLRESMMGGGDDTMDAGGEGGDVASPMSLSGISVLAPSPAQGQGESDENEMAAAALANFADAEGLEGGEGGDEGDNDLASVMMRELEMSMSGGGGSGFGVEGGVGMRRLASGLAGDEDDDSSEDSDD